jgi:CheY-like chemotaxis protein
VLAGGIAHDFNNLLTGVLGHAELALGNLPPGSPAQANIAGIMDSARAAAELTHQMLAYSGRGQFVVEALDLNRLVAGMARLLEVSISKKALIKYELADGLPAIEADGTQLRQVAMNLIVNASEAIGDRSGVISLATRLVDCDREYFRGAPPEETLPPGRYVALEVGDTGCGMDKETRERIFEPFFTTKFTGRGLGLAAVLGIVRGHGGTIKIASEPGKGTEFQLLFPALDELPVSSGEEEAKPAGSWRGTGTVLLVDDEERVLRVGKLFLERAGFDVLTAPDGRAALEIFERRVDDITCVVLDLTMPEMDGAQCFHELRRIREDIAVILSSGYSQQDLTQRFAGRGFAGFVQKPYLGSELTAKLKAILDKGLR